MVTLRWLLGFLLFGAMAPAASGQHQLWENVYQNGLRSTFAVATAHAKADKTWILCSVTLSPHGSRYGLVLVDGDGRTLLDLQLAGSLGPSGVGFDVPADVVCDDEGNAYVLGTSTRPDGRRCPFLFSYGMDGVLRWSTLGPNNTTYHDYEGVELILTPDNALVSIGAMLESFSTNRYMKVDAYGMDGSHRWIGTWGDYTYAAGVAADQFGNVYAAGSQAVPGANLDAVLIKFTRDGLREWGHGFDGGLLHDYAYDVEVGRDGIAVVAGSTTTGGAVHGLAFAVDPDGNRIWEHVATPVSQQPHSDFRAINQRPDGGWRLLGGSSGGGSNLLFLEDLDESGMLVRQRQTETRPVAYYDWVRQMVTDHLGCSTAVGYCSRSGDVRAFLWQIGADGTSAGLHVFDRGNSRDTQLVAVCLDESDRPVVAGNKVPDTASHLTAWVMGYAPQSAAGTVGGGCPGSAGLPAVSWTGPPSLQSSSIDVAVDHALPNAPAALIVAARSSRRQIARNCEVLHSLVDARPPRTTLTDSFGSARLTLALPSGPEFSGLTIHAQWLIEDPAGAQYLSRTVSASKVVAFRLGF